MYLIVVPLKKELKYLKQSLEKMGHVFELSSIGQADRQMALWASQGFCLAIGGYGSSQYEASCRKLLAHQQWKALVCAGSAGALSARLEIGSVVCATEVVDIGTLAGAPQSHFERFFTDRTYLEKLILLLKAEDSFLQGGIVSSEQEIVNSDDARNLEAQTSALAVACEGIAGARAARALKIPFLELRAITDRANATARDDFNHNLQLAMESLAHYIHRFVEGNNN